MKHEIRGRIKQVRPKRVVQSHHQQSRINRNRHKRQNGVRIRNTQIYRLHPSRLPRLFNHHGINFCFGDRFLCTVGNDFNDVGGFQCDGGFEGRFKVHVEEKDEGEDEEDPEEYYCWPKHVEGDPFEENVRAETEENGGHGDRDEGTCSEHRHGVGCIESITVDSSSSSARLPVIELGRSPWWMSLNFQGLAGGADQPLDDAVAIFSCSHWPQTN